MIIRGRNHYPQDIELTAECSNTHLRAGHGAAFSITVGNKEQLVIVHEVERSALRTLKREGQSCSDAIIQDIRRAVSADHHIHALAVAFIKSGNIPKTSSFKIQRRLFRQKFLTVALSVVGLYRADIP